jgi:hypothetical protein
MKSLSSFFKSLRTERNEPSEEAKLWKRGYEAYQAGKKCFMEKQDKEALRCFDAAVDLGFTEGGLYGMRGTILRQMSFDLDAIDDFTKAIEEEPDDSNSLVVCQEEPNGVLVH